ncbi:MAG: GlsB/YeaQ/YmgE family stress response membrane protein [Acidobacteriota bacterium]
MFGLISWAIFGLVAGALAKFIMPGDDPGGCFITSIIGIVGAMIGGFVGNFLGIGSINTFSLPGLGLAVVGALILLGAFRALKG